MRTALRFLVTLCGLAPCLAFAAHARAAEPSVSVEPPASETCINGAELRDALARAGVPLALGVDYARDTIRDPYATGAPDRVVVTLSGTPQTLAVTITRQGGAETQPLAPATCETATDAAAAFLVSALAPAVVPALPREATPALAPHGDTARPLAYAARVEPARLNALRHAFDGVPRREPSWLMPSILAVLGGLALAVPGLEAKAQSNGATTFSTTDSVLFYTGGATWVGGGVGGFLLGPDHGTDLMFASLLAGQGFLFASGFVPGSTLGHLARTSGFVAGSVLAVPNVVVGRPLERVHAERDEVRKGCFTRGRAAELEADLSRTDPAVPTWLLFAPPVAGFTVAAVGDLSDKHVPSGYGSLDVGLAGLYLAYTMLAAGRGGAGQYERALERAGLKTLSLGPGPAAGGLSLAGTF